MSGILSKVIGDSSYKRCFGTRDEEVERVGEGMLDESGEVGGGDIGDVLALGETVHMSEKALKVLEQENVMYLAVPPLPGTMWIASTKGDWANFQAKVCSLPPLPTSRIRRGSCEAIIGL